MGYNRNYIGFNVNYNGVYWFDGFYWWDVIRQMGNNRTTVIVLMETITISVMVSNFFQQGDDTRTIDNIKLKIDFAI